MRFFYHISIFLLTSFLLLGCSHTNAFTRFHFDTLKERATSSLRTSKIAKDQEIDGVISSIYLNEVEPQKYNGMEYFYIALYTKEGKKLYDPNVLDERDMKLTLNGKLPVKIQKLTQENRFTEFIPLSNDWNRYYIVAFPHEDSEKLSLTLQNDSFASAPLVYQKGEQ